MAARQKRLITDYINARREGAACGFDIRPINPDDYEHYYILFTPINGVYKGQRYIIQLDTVWDKEKYPICRPKVKFINHCWHVNIGSSGGICVTFLNSADQWVPSYTFTSIMQSIAVLFDEPNPSSPMNSEAGRLWSDLTTQYNRLKRPNLPIEELDRLYMETYRPFIERTARECGTINQYVKWFPQINDQYYAEHIDQIIAEQAEFDELAERIIKKKNTVADIELKSVADAAKPDIDKPDTAKPETDKPNKDKLETDKPETNKSEPVKPDIAKPETDKPEPAKAKAPRWAKYQK